MTDDNDPIAPSSERRATDPDGSRGTLGWTVGEEEAGARLDRHLSDRLAQPRNQIRHWIDDGRVTVEGREVKASAVVEAGARVECRPPEAVTDPGIEPEEGELVVLHEDDHLVVLDKPAGLAVHPGAGRRVGTLAHRLLAHYPEMAQVGGRGRPGIVHRLDLDTTGVMVVARRSSAYQALVTAFSERRVAKRYVAIAYGRPAEDEGTIDRPIARHRGDRKKMTVHGGGRRAVTHYRVRASEAGISWLELDLATGRTHQIRVHLKDLGHPLVGDPVYGEARWRALPRALQPTLRDFPRPALHAWRLAFDHPDTGERLLFEAPVPDDVRGLWHRVAGK